jgi:hypothetical protein
MEWLTCRLTPKAGPPNSASDSESLTRSSRLASKELEQAHETAIAPWKAAVASRQEKARLESEKQTQRRAAVFP